MIKDGDLVPGFPIAQLTALLLALQLPFGLALGSPLKSDEQVIFLPTAAQLSNDGTHWIVPVHAWIFEPECELFQGKGLATLAAALGIEQGAARSKIFRERAAWFLVDNERGKRISLNIDPESRRLGPSQVNGHLFAEVRLERRSAGPELQPYWLQYAVQLPKTDQRIFAGQALMVPNKGLSVISDIDDTVKVSNVRDKKALLENTFLKPFVPAPGMAALYQELAGRGATFHYVSSSPWQLYPPLRDFFNDVGLPDGSFHLKSFRFKDESFFNLFKSSRNTKPPEIETLLVKFPERDFILIGDSGEADPEIYGDIARRYPGRVRAILIRNVTAESAGDSRYVDGAFRDLPPDLWLVFDHAKAAGTFLAGRK